jgi:hypothetical protein
MAETAAWLVDHVIPKVPVRQWVLSFPIPLRSLLTVHPEMLAPVLQVIHRLIATRLIKQADIKRSEAATGAVTISQRWLRMAMPDVSMRRTDKVIESTPANGR